MPKKITLKGSLSIGDKPVANYSFDAEDVLTITIELGELGFSLDPIKDFVKDLILSYQNTEFNSTSN